MRSNIRKNVVITGVILMTSVITTFLFKIS
jgi:hypothetical protein